MLAFLRINPQKPRPFSHLTTTKTQGNPSGRSSKSLALIQDGTTLTHIMINELISEMVDAGVHYGHQTKKWNPRMKPFLMKDKGGIYIINLEKTVQQLDKASDFLADLVSKNKQILFVGCKRQAQDAIREAAEATGQHYVNHRWLGGMLTNFKTVRQSIKRLKDMETAMQDGTADKMSKKEALEMQRELVKLQRSLGGIKDLEKLPDALFIIDVGYQKGAVAEANKLGIPVIGVVDSNNSPDGVSYVIPGNDDSSRAIRLYARGVADSILEGRSQVLQEIIAGGEADEFVEVSDEGQQA